MTHPVSSLPLTLDPCRLSLPLRGPSLQPIVLGSGAFGIVYSALLDGTYPVALKVVRTPAAPPPGVVESLSQARRRAVAMRQFRREVRRYTALRGAGGVARFYGQAECWGGGGERVYMCVMERMEEVKEEGGGGGVVEVGWGVATALAEMHARGFAHGDVKMANVMRERGGGAVKLVDLGLSREFGRGEHEGRVEGEEEGARDGDGDGDRDGDGGWGVASVLGGMEARGTPAYLSPEAWGGWGALRESEVAQKADVYALGMVLYELGTGGTAWAEVPHWGVFVAVCHRGERPEWPEGWEGEGEGFRGLVERCWRQDYRERPTSEEVAEELGRMLGKEVIGRGGVEWMTSGAGGGGGGGGGGGRGGGSVVSSPGVGVVRPLVNFICEFERRIRGMDKIEDGACGTPFWRSGERQRVRSAEAAVTKSRVMAEFAASSMASSSLLDGSVPDAPASSTASERERSVQNRSPAPGEQLVDSRHMRGTMTGWVPRSYSVGATMEIQAEVGDAIVVPKEVEDVVEERNSLEDDVDDVDDGDTGGELREDPKKSGMSAARAKVVERPRGVEYPYKKEVLSGDCVGLCRVLTQSVRDGRAATFILEALGVVLGDTERHCETFTKRSGMRAMATILSRYGSRDGRLCKAACVCVLRLARSDSPTVEAELRATGACELGINAVRWHPGNLPVVQSAACALHQLCRMSPALCSITVALGGLECALRVVARSGGSFNRDVPVALAGLELIEYIANLERGVLERGVLERETVEKVLECCQVFEVERIDERCLAILLAVTKQADGQEKVFSTEGAMSILAGLIRRTTDMSSLQKLSRSEGDEKEMKDARDQGAQRASRFKVCAGIVSELAKLSNRLTMRAALLSSNFTEYLIHGIDFHERWRGSNCEEDLSIGINLSTTQVVNDAFSKAEVPWDGVPTTLGAPPAVSEAFEPRQVGILQEQAKEQQRMLNMENLQRIIRIRSVSGLECLKSITRLGTDMCGAMQMEGVFVVTRDLLDFLPEDRSLANRVALFLESMLIERGADGIGAETELIYEATLHLQQHWGNDFRLQKHVNEALRVLREALEPEELDNGEDHISQVHIGGRYERLSALKLFLKKSPRRKRRY